MIHPLFKILASQPDMLAEHLAGYGELLVAQAQEVSAGLRTRAWWMALTLLCAAMTLFFSGTSVLLLAALPLPGMPAPWLLAVVPAAALCLTLVGAWALKHRAPLWPASGVRDQVQLDLALLRASGGL